jgi:hypothetical protein
VDHRDHLRAARALQRLERARAPCGQEAASKDGKEDRREEKNREEVAEVDGREDTAG